MGSRGQPGPGIGSLILLDTQVLVWLALDDLRLGAQAHGLIGRSWAEGEAAVSAITFWEIAMLHQKRRLVLLTDIDSWRTSLFEEGLVEVPVGGDVGIRAATLTDFHADPADRLIVATALQGHQLVTADRRILEWPGSLNRVDATE